MNICYISFSVPTVVGLTSGWNSFFIIYIPSCHSLRFLDSDSQLKARYNFVTSDLAKISQTVFYWLHIDSRITCVAKVSFSRCRSRASERARGREKEPPRVSKEWQEVVIAPAHSLVPFTCFFFFLQSPATPTNSYKKRYYRNR